MKDFDGYVAGMKHSLVMLPKEEDIKKHFVNTPLEEFSDSIFAFWVSEPLIQSADNCFDVFREAVQDYINECLSLAECARASRNETFVGKGWKITSPSDVHFLSCKLETILLDKLCGFEVLFRGNLPENKDKYSTARCWAIALESFPRINKIGIDLDAFKANKKAFSAVNPLLTLESLDSIIVDLKKCQRVAKGFTIEHDYSTITRFVFFMLDNGVPRTRKMYRELYRALDIFGAIPDYIKKSHKTTTSSDPESNYIKSLVNTISKHQDTSKRDSL